MENLEAKLYCPKCGEKATKFYVHTVKGFKYIYLAHYVKEEKKCHKWYCDRLSEDLLRRLWSLGLEGCGQNITLERSDLEALRKFFVRRKGYTEWEKKRAKEILDKMCNAVRVVVTIY